MKYIKLILGIISLLIIGCNSGSGSGGGNGKKDVGSKLEPWQISMLGQEGHGGDAIVCFGIPIERALQKVVIPPKDNCNDAGICQGTGGSCPIGQICAPSSGVIWKMTEEGRNSIESAKPLEQYMAEKIASKKEFIDALNLLSLTEAYERVLNPFLELPGAYQQISAVHQNLGWLEEDGFADEYGLMDVADSGFVTNLDRTKCKELQAVVRRDNQLWYDADIVGNFDVAGKALIQLHEELYTWGKSKDKMNIEIEFRYAHSTSTKTRRLILKLLNDDISTDYLNSTLKSHGFSIFFWGSGMSGPVKLGQYMTKELCIAEREVLAPYFKYNIQDMQFNLLNFTFPRYLKTGYDTDIRLRNNYPELLADLISLTGDYSGPWQEYNRLATQLFDEFKADDSCGTK